MTNLLITAAYKYVAMSVMLVQVNQFSDSLHLNGGRPITYQDLRAGGHVAPPRLMGFNGSLLTTNYFFGFSNGRLANFKKSDFWGDDDVTIRGQLAKYSKMKSPIGTNEACQLARTWLAALSVDVVQMEKKHPPKITQWELPPSGTGALTSERVLMPIFQIDWGAIPMNGNGHDLPALTMAIFGPTKELIEYHMIDDSFFTKPKIRIFNSEPLLTIPDAYFRGFSDLQCSNLVMQATKPAP